jgi:hypothetical protein
MKMNLGSVLAAAVAICGTGCATQREAIKTFTIEHPVATGFIAGSAALTFGLTIATIAERDDEPNTEPPTSRAKPEKP